MDMKLCFDNPFSPRKFLNIDLLLTISTIENIHCFVVRIYELIAHCRLSNMQRKIPPNCLKGNYGNHMGEFRNTSFVIFDDERVN